VVVAVFVAAPAKRARVHARDIYLDRAGPAADRVFPARRVAVPFATVAIRWIDPDLHHVTVGQNRRAAVAAAAATTVAVRLQITTAGLGRQRRRDFLFHYRFQHYGRREI